MVRMIAVSDSLPANVRQRTGVPSRVTAIAITTWGRSARKSLECPNARLPDSTGLVTSSSSTFPAVSVSRSGPTASPYTPSNRLDAGCTARWVGCEKTNFVSRPTAGPGMAMSALQPFG